MKYFPHAISGLALIVVLSYVRYDDQRTKQQLQSNEVITQAVVDKPKSGSHPFYFTARSLDLPDSLYFAGERVPLEVPDVRERLDRELHINSYWHNNTIFLIKKANRWFPQMERILKEHGIPDDFKYLTAIEGSFRNDISYKNAVGFWQFLKPAGKEFGLEINQEIDERYDPIKSTEAACKYLRRSYKKLNNWTLAAASYNRGVRGMQRALLNQEVDSYYDLLLNEETSRYVFRILAIKEIIEHPQKYGFHIEEDHLYDEEPLRYVEVKQTINDLVRFAHNHGINYKELKRYNPWLRKDRLTVRNGKSYKIAIPV